MMAQVLFFNFFFEKDLHLNAVEFCGKKDGHQNFGYCKKILSETRSRIFIKPNRSSKRNGVTDTPSSVIRLFLFLVRRLC